MAAEISKPDFSYQWASGGAIVSPSDVKVQTGWTAEVPPFQWENWSQNRQDNAILHLFQKGISEWDALSNYYFTASGVRSYVQGSDGQIYVAVQDNIGQNPTTDATDTYWTLAFPRTSPYVVSTGSANAFVATYIPAITGLVDGLLVRFKANFANTATATLNANGLGATPIVGGNHAVLQGGEIGVNAEVTVQYNSSIGAGSWVITAIAGGATQVSAATQSQHAVQLTQLQSLITNMQLFTASGSFTVPANVTKVKYRAVAPGGGGGGSNAVNAAAGGAGSGSYSEGVLSVTPGAALTITIGTFGAQGTTGNGVAGGTTSIIGSGISVSVFGGGASLGANGGVPVGAQGLGGSISVTSGASVLSAFNVQGAPGQAAFYGSASGYFSGNGGNSVFGGGLPGSGGYPGGTFGAYGAGGAGGANNNFGGNGSPSAVILEW